MVKVGDRVRVSGRSDWANGLEGEVTAVDGGNDILLVYFEDARGRGHGVGAACWYVDKKEVSPIVTFKVGDKVVPTPSSDFEGRRGTAGTVVTVDDDNVPYLVKFDDGASHWYRVGELDAYVEPVVEDLKVNDFVVVTAEYPAWATGRVGVIEAINDGTLAGHLIRIPGETKEGHGGGGMGDGGYGKWWMSEDSFVRLTPEALPVPVSGPTKEEIEQKQRREIIDEIAAKLQTAYPEGDLEAEEAIEDILTRTGEKFGIYLYLA